MYPAQCDIKLYRGDDFELLLRLREGTQTAEGYVPGAYMDLTGWSGNAQIRQSEDSTSVLGEFTVEVLLPQAGNTLGGVHLRMTGEQTKALPASAYWDAQLTDPEARVHTYLRGKVATGKDVTR